ncbi:MAG: protein translocase subunit SecF [Candidatus Pacearchaeota archaeon]
MEEQTTETKKTFSEFYNKNYKLFLIIPLVLLIFSLVYIGYFYSQNNDFIKKDVSLTGGTTITIFSENINLEELKQALSQKTTDFSIRELSDFNTGKQQAVVIESPLDSAELKSALEEILKYKLTEDNSSIEFSGSSLSSSFYKQLQIAILFSFVLMAIVVFVIFRTPIVSGAVVLSAFADILMTIVTVNLLGIKVSSAGIVAFLMLIGYSVDTDIMLTTRLLKGRESSLNRQLFNSFKTGITMTLTSIAAVGVALFFVYSFSETLSQIFTIMLIGLGFDIFNTWITNASILKWYLERKK